MATIDENVPPLASWAPKNDGGSAFPSVSLRDYFASKAMSGEGIFRTNVGDDVLRKHAELYYRMADAMLKARTTPATPEG